MRGMRMRVPHSAVSLASARRIGGRRAVLGSWPLGAGPRPVAWSAGATRAVPRAFFGSKESNAPPRPNSKFKKADLKRIKTDGPTMDDLRAHFEVTRTSGSKTSTKKYDFVPYEVLGNKTAYPSKEPAWEKLPHKTP